MLQKIYLKDLQPGWRDGSATKGYVQYKYKNLQ